MQVPVAGATSRVRRAARRQMRYVVTAVCRIASKSRPHSLSTLSLAPCAAGQIDLVRPVTPARLRPY